MNKTLLKQTMEALAAPEPRGRLVDPHFPYVHSSSTDIRKTFARYGWVPPSEKRHGRN